MDMTGVFFMSKLILIIVTLFAVMSGSRPGAQQSTGSQDDLLVAAQGADENLYAIQILNAASGETTDIATLHGDRSEAGWSPKGGFIYLTEDSTANRQSLTVLNMDDGNRQTVTDQLNIQCLLSISWSPDDRYLAYSVPEDRFERVHIYDTETQQEVLLQGVDYDIFLIGWSADERFFAYESIDAASQYDITIWDTEEKRVRYMLDTREMKWSPTEARLTYQTSEGDLVILNAADGSEQHYAVGHFDGWSADGRYALVHTLIDDQTIQVGRIDTQSDEAPLMLIINGTLFEYLVPVSSADGRYLLYQDTTSESAAVLDFEDGSSTALIDSTLIDHSFTEWAPTGHWLTLPVLQHDKSHKSFWMFDLDRQTQQLFELTSEYIIYNNPVLWSPDGKQMALWTADGVVFFSAADWSLHPVAEDALRGWSRWSVDGRYLAFMSGDLDSWDVYAVDTQDFEKHNLTNSAGMRDTLVGWRGSIQHNSLIQCGTG